jgi:hypothetical protein
MICPANRIRTPQAQDLVGEALREIAGRQLTLELLTESKDEARWNQLIRKHHYLKEHRLVGESLRYVVKQNGKWLALLGWSSAAFHLRPRDAWIGWTDAQRQAGRHLLACNARFALLQPKGQSPNLASQILSLNLKHLSEDWQQRYGHPILLVETYVDPERFHGTCYRAANWTEIGVTQGFGRSRLEFYQLHQKPKAIFLYELHPKARKILSAPVMPAPWAAYRREADPLKYPLSTQQTKSLLQALGKLQDPRSRKRVHRRVSSIVAIAIAAMIAGNNSLLSIGEFAQSLTPSHLRTLRATQCRKTGKYLAPSESTIRRVLQRLEPEPLDALLTDWLRSHLQALAIASLAVDGKCVRTAAKINGQPLQLFGALDAQTKLFCHQIPIPSKTNEIPSLKALLKDLDLRGTLVSADALHTQTATGAHLVEEKKADYLLVVKANQPKLFDRLARVAKAPSTVFFPSGPHVGSGSRPA